jgi:predicted dinucleotide-binding enzyme
VQLAGTTMKAVVLDSVAGAVGGAEVVLLAVPGPAVTDAMQAAAPLDGRIVLDAANSFGQQQHSLRLLADAFPRARWVRDAGFDPVDLGGVDDSKLQDPGSALWTFAVTRDEATSLVARIKSGDRAAADPLTAPFGKFRDRIRCPARRERSQWPMSITTRS